jgi:hypothetical protein
MPHSPDRGAANLPVPAARSPTAKAVPSHERPGGGARQADNGPKTHYETASDGRTHQRARSLPLRVCALMNSTRCWRET